MIGDIAKWWCQKNSKWPGIPKLLLLLRSVLPGGNEQLCVLGPKITRSKLVPLLVCRRVRQCYESFRGIQPRPPNLWFLQARQAGVQPQALTQLPAPPPQESPLACLLVMTSLSLVLELHS